MSPPTRTREIAARAYGPNFDHPEVAPVRDVAPGRHVLELWHGPTLAFKDMALQCMPLYFSEALEMAHARGATDLDFLILVATSGDTGVAALNGFADRAHTRICVYYPDAGVSALQELQMVTQPGENLTVFRLGGDFDACQTSVKAVFDDAAFAAELAERHQLSLSSANSINWGRLLPQIVYYASGYADLAARGAVAAGEPVDVCVPTGNFGNILAAYYAKRMGVPLGRLLCASNTNNVLFDFLSSGVYDIAARSLVKTPSPSMDILISSNLERLLYDLCGDPALIAGWMTELKANGRFAVDDATRERLRAEFTGAWVDNDDVPADDRPRAARAGLPARPPHGRRLGGRRAARRQRAGAHRQHGALEQVRRRRGARPHRRACRSAGARRRRRPRVARQGRRPRAGSDRAAAAARRPRPAAALRRARGGRPRAGRGEPARVARRGRTERPAEDGSEGSATGMAACSVAPLPGLVMTFRGGLIVKG